jgi:competence protein ComEA
MFEDDRIRIGACALVAVVVVLLALRALDGHSAAPGEPVAVSAAAGGQARPRAGQGQAGLVVHVAGAVRRPGVYRVPAGSRAEAAVRMAGGFARRAETAGVNLAAPLQDGQQVVVPMRGAAASVASAPGAASTGASASASAANGGGAAPGAPVSLSSATAEQLDTLDGIGPTLAQRIVQYRDAHGGFRSVQELRQVEGIGDKRFEALKAALQP